jgi:CubicO group peptidase (beta-lactamase class C family)
MHRLLVPALALALGSAVAGLQVQGGVVVAGDVGRKVDEFMSRLEAWGFSGAVIVAKDGQIVMSKGYGLANREQKIPFTPETVSSIGSITKQFTAAAILKLEMQGKLKVGDPIGKYLPGVPPDKADITIHHLLTHTAGVRADFGGRDSDPIARDDLVKLVLASPLRFKPGVRYEYSNEGYSLAGAIVERVSGASYEAFLSEHLFKPAGTRLPRRRGVGQHHREGVGARGSRVVPEGERRHPLDHPRHVPLAPCARGRGHPVEGGKGEAVHAVREGGAERGL